MRAFDFKKEYQKLLIPEVVALLSQIHEHKGQQNLFIEAKKDVLSDLLEIAKIQSTEASNRIEGIITTDDRLKKIVRDKTIPKNRSEREIAGYRDVLSTIHDSYDYIPVRPGMILSCIAIYINTAAVQLGVISKTPIMSLQRNFRTVQNRFGSSRFLHGKLLRL